MLPARGPMPKMFRDFGKPLFLDGSQVGELLETTPRRSRNQQPYTLSAKCSTLICWGSKWASLHFAALLGVSAASARLGPISWLRLSV